MPMMFLCSYIVIRTAFADLEPVLN